MLVSDEASLCLRVPHRPLDDDLPLRVSAPPLVQWNIAAADVLASAFWSQANERVNTLVHEESHFNAVGGTQDYVYGKPGCLALAQSNPLQASHNAGAYPPSHHSCRVATSSCIAPTHPG